MVVELVEAAIDFVREKFEFPMEKMRPVAKTKVSREENQKVNTLSNPSRKIQIDGQDRTIRKHEEDILALSSIFLLSFFFFFFF